jgi:ketosteroid isomerase-like protein
MKKITFILITLITFSGSAQKKKKNGTIYIDHPGIDLVESFNKAWTDGDIEKAGSMLSEDFRIRNGNNLNKDAKGSTKDQMIGNMTWWYNNMDYLKLTVEEGAYPDAIEYKDSGIWVQTWNHLYGVNKKNGAKVDMPLHRLYRLNNDGSKINAIVEYNNQNSFRNVRDSNHERKNGTIYINHEHINSVRKAMYSFANGDAEKAYSFFHDNAVFIDINETKNMSKEETIARDSKIFSNWTLTGLDESGYPDYLEYDWRSSKVVQSWWNFRMTRNSDSKEVVLPVFFIDDFDEDGKIIRRNAYWNAQLLK